MKKTLQRNLFRTRVRSGVEEKAYHARGPGTIGPDLRVDAHKTCKTSAHRDLQDEDKELRGDRMSV